MNDRPKDRPGRSARHRAWCVQAAIGTVTAGVIALALPAPAPANGPPIQSETAFTTGLNGAAVRSFVRVTRRSGKAGEMTALVVPIVVPYEAIDNRLVLGLGLPLLTKTLRMSDGTERSSGFGIGDLMLFGKVNLFQHDEHQQTLRIAGKVGLTLPTGSTRITDGTGRLPRPLQRGTGTVNPSVLLVATKLWRRFGLNGDVGYTAYPRSGDVDPGDVVSYDIAASFRVLPWVFRRFPDHQINIMLELNGAWQGSTFADDVKDPNSGGNILFVSPGLQYIYDTLLLEASFQIPVPGATALAGEQLTPDWAALVGLRWLIE